MLTTPASTSAATMTISTTSAHTSLTATAPTPFATPINYYCSYWHTGPNEVASPALSHGARAIQPSSSFAVVRRDAKAVHGASLCLGATSTEGVLFASSHTTPPYTCRKSSAASSRGQPVACRDFALRRQARTKIGRLRYHDLKRARKALFKPESLRKSPAR